MVFQLNVKITQLTTVERIPARALKGGCGTDVNHLAGDSYTRKGRENIDLGFLENKNLNLRQTFASPSLFSSAISLCTEVCGFTYTLYFKI